MGVKTPVSVIPMALDRLINYKWPGNVRELENMVERELIKAQSGSLLFDSLVTKKHKEEMADNIETPAEMDTFDELITKHIKNVLIMTNGKVHGPKGAAQILNIKPDALRKKMDKLGIVYGRRYRVTT